MDLSFWSKNEEWEDCWYLVSILVMMDLSFWSRTGMIQSLWLSRFNPCYDGFIILMLSIFSYGNGESSFNPCYDGFIILIGEEDAAS